MDDSRSELVFLNIAEASGWVAYNCNPSDEATETENYRIVVIRQSNNELIYDSLVPLAADLCTHGFEMDPEDPRLQKLGRNVDAEIIEPLEAYQKSLNKEKRPSEAPPVQKPEEPTAPEERATPPENDGKEGATATEPAAAAPNTPAASGAISISGVDGDSVLLQLNNEEIPVAGDRFFLRTPPKIIAIPGTGEKIVTSEGEVTGLVEIVSVENGSARARILSGSAPETGVAEKVPNP